MRIIGVVLPVLLLIGPAHSVAAAAPVAGAPVFCEPNNGDDADGGTWYPNPPGCPANWHKA